MLLFFDLFYSLNDLLELYDDVIEAIENRVSTTGKQQLEKELHGIQHEFRNLWLSAGSGPTDEAGMLACLEKILGQADKIGRQAALAGRFDLTRSITTLQAQIKSSQAYKNAYGLPGKGRHLASALGRPFLNPTPLTCAA
jgi:hypothetical protein